MNFSFLNKSVSNRFYMIWTCVFMIIISITLQGSTVLGLDNGLGRTPAMGWNSWYDVLCSSDMNEKTIRATADAMVATGLSKLGYQYINLDDCWAGGRTSEGRVYPEAKRFPSGMKALADYVHSKGLKFGVYTDRGTFTCAGRPGSENHEEVDAQTYADWGVDYVKEDSCYATQDHVTAIYQYGKMRDALNETERPIYFSLCGWERWYAPMGHLLGNSWRIGWDDSNWPGVLVDINDEVGLAQYAGPGGWNDPCLLLGTDHQNNLVMTEVQSRTQFSIWCIMAAPLLISSNIRNISNYALQTYSNTEVIAVHQDPLGKQGIRLAGGDLPGSVTNVWGRPLSGHAWAVMFINTGKVNTDVACNQNCFQQMGLSSSDVVNVRDLWLHQDIGTANGSYNASSVPADGGCILLKFTPVSKSKVRGS